MQMRPRRQPSRAYPTNHLARLHLLPSLDVCAIQMPIDTFNPVPVVDPDHAPHGPMSTEMIVRRWPPLNDLAIRHRYYLSSPHGCDVKAVVVPEDPREWGDPHTER